MRNAGAMMLAGLLAGPLRAELAPASCDTQRDMPEMVACSTYHLGTAERALGEALTDLRARFPQTATQLDLAQAAWASYRDATCYYAASPDDFARGSEAVLDELFCKRSETLRRAAELRLMFTN